MEQENKIKILSPKLDVVFQALFGDVESENITKEFLESILKKKIEKIDLNQNLILRRKFKNDKLGVLDILVKLDKKEICNIELQIIGKDNIIDRILYYWSRLYVKQINKGSDYKQLEKTISILIADFEIKKLENLKYHSCWKIIETENRKIILTNKLEIHIIELPKIQKEENTKDTLLDWLYFLEDPKSERVDERMKENKALQEASKKLRDISADEKMQRIAELREKAIMDEKAIYSLGMKEGIKQYKIETIKIMLEKNIDIALISEIIGLTIEDIEKLKNSNNTDT